MRIYDYMKGILGAMGVGEDVGVPEPSWRIEEYLEAIYKAIKAGGGGGGADLTTFLAPQFSSGTPYSAGDYVVKGGALYKFTEDHAAGAWTGTDAEQTLTSVEMEALYAALSTKANVDGSYASMTVGNAEQLVSTVGIEDKVPYNFRTSGGSADIGDRETDMVVGGTVAWNQNIKNGNFADTSEWTASNSNISMSVSDNTANVIATASGDNRMYQNLVLIQGHKYLLAFSVKSANPNEYVLYWFYGSAQNEQYLSYKTASSDWENVNVIRECNGTSVQQLRLQCSTATTHQYKNICLFDLTTMFGSTIADYIYALEQSNAGSGVAYFRKLFPKPYYAYDAGSLQSVNASAHKMVGFNQWDEEWELGYYNINTGASTPSDSQIRCKNKIKVVPNTTYYIKASNTLWILEYDADDIYLNKYTSKANQVFMTSANTQYIRFYTLSSYGITYKHDICINIHWDGERDGEYMPYQQWVYPLDSSLTLRGILKLDENNNLYADGDRYLPDGTVERRYGVVDLGTLDWTTGTNDCQYANLPSNPETSQASTKPNAILSNGFEYSGNAFGTGTIDKRFCFNNIKIWLYDSALVGKTEAQVAIALSGVYLVYEIATPTTETADAYQQTQIVDDFGTEEFVDAAVEANERDVAIPVGHNTFYQANLRAKLEMAPNSPSSSGDFIVRHTDGENTYVPLVIPAELPTNPSTDGTYSLKVTVADGVATLSWVADA